MDEDIVLNLAESSFDAPVENFAEFTSRKKKSQPKAAVSNSKAKQNRRSQPTVELSAKPKKLKPSRPGTSNEVPPVESRTTAVKAKLGKRKAIGDDNKRSTKPSPSPKVGFKKAKRSISEDAGVRIKEEEESDGTISAKQKSVVTAKKKEREGPSDVFSSDSFSSISGLDRRLVDRLERADGFGFSRMTAIQKLTIPNLLAGKDCFVKSQTGSGKTLAYALPCVQKLSEMEPRIRRQDGPYAIVLTPTRELAIQTYEVFEKLLKAFIWIVPGYIAGGEKRKSEKARLRKGINVLVCTPGRLTDHLRQTSNLSLARVQWMIYDEADRLLDGGFEQDIRSVIERLRHSRQGPCQSVLLSATLNKGVKQLADLALTNPVFVTPVMTDSGMAPESNEMISDDSFVLPASLKQCYIVMPAKQRLLTLIALVFSKFKMQSDDPCRKMLVFLATQDAVDFHYYLLDHIVNDRASDSDDEDHQRRKRKRFQKTEDEDGLAVNVQIYRLHGNMSQQERTAVYKEFSASKKAILLATDVAARGLHIPRLDCIVQYNTPGVAAEYVHRVGRTARMGRTGSAILFLLPSELAYLDVLNEYKIQMREMRQAEFMDALKEEAGMQHLPEALHEFQRRCEEFVYSRQDVYEMATKAFVSFVRAYTTYPSHLKSIFNVHALHLGHLAKCFALNETPKQLAAFRSGERRPLRSGGETRSFRHQSGDRGTFNPRTDRYTSSRREFSAGRSKSQVGPARRKPVDMSEYGSGFDSIPFL